MGFIGLPWWLSCINNPPAKAGSLRFDPLGWEDPWVGRDSPGEGNGNPPSFLAWKSQNMDRGAWRGYNLWGCKRVGITTQQLNKTNNWGYNIYRNKM